MKEIRHRTRSHSKRGKDVFPTTSRIEDDPAAQETIQRIGVAVGGGHAAYIDVHAYVLSIAAVCMKGRAKHAA